MAAPNELWQQYADWNARINAVKAKGLPTAPAIEVGTQDLKRIYAGGAPRPVQDISDELAAAYSGQAQVAAKQTGSGLLDIPSNVAKDFGNLITGIVPAAVHEVQQIASPSAWGKLAHGLNPNVQEQAFHAAGIAHPGIADWARYDQQLPIIGGLIPGLWTLGTSRKTKAQHPLISFLDMLPFAGEGAKLAGAAAEGADTAAVGSWQESLTKGKFAQAGLRASGVADKVEAYLTEHPTFWSEYLPKYERVWRQWSQIGRAKTRAANAELAQLAREDGVLDASMSMEDTARIGTLAATYNPRYEQPATVLTPSTLSDLVSRWDDGPGALPQGDIQAFSASPVGVVASGPVTLTRDLAGPDAVPVRIRREDVIFTDHPGVVTARNIIPDITYKASDIPLITRYRDWAEEQAANGLRHNADRTYTRPDGTRVEDTPPLVRVPTGDGRPDAIFSSDTGLGDIYNRWQRHEQRAQVAMQDTVDAVDRVRAAKEKLDGRAGKIYRFGESNEDFAKRASGPVDILTIRDAIQPVSEYFIHHQADQFARGPIRDLVGEDGLFAKLNDQLTNGDSRGARSTLSAISRKMRTSAFVKAFGGESSLHDYVNYIRDEMTNILHKGNAHSSAARMYDQAVRTAKASMEKFTLARDKADGSAAEYWSSLDRTPEARFRKLADSYVRDKTAGLIKDRSNNAMTLARTLYEGENLTAALDAIRTTTTEMLDRVEAATRIPQLKELVGSQTFATMMDETVHDWRSLIDAGYDPVWLHSPDSDVQARAIAGRITPFTQSFIKPSFEKSVAFNLANGKLDLAVGVTDAVMSKWRAAASTDFINWIIDESGTAHSYQAMEAELRQTMRPLHPDDPQALNAAVQAEINRTTEPFQPESYMPSYKTRLTQGDHYVIDKTVAKGFRRLMNKDGLPVDGVYNRGMNVWRVAVLTGPRHIVHVAIGGLVFMIGQHPEALMEARNAFDALRSGELPEAVTQGILEENPDVLWQAATGKWLGSRTLQSLGKRLGSMEHALTTFETFTADWQRAMVYLSQVDHGVTSEEALAAVYKTFVNMDSLTPFERSTIRQAFPFWTFTRHALKYVLTYPADHPLRAGILSALNNQLNIDQKSGEPGKLNSLFFLGHPDALGNIQTVDFKNLNPFRSIGGIATLAGFLQGANPAIQLLARGLGYDPVGGVPMIYQPLTYDAYTGAEKATRPGMGVGNIAETIVPEVSILDHFIGFTGQMRALKKYSSAGYQAALYNSLNLPFAYTKQNIYDIRAKSEHARYANAEQAVAAAEKGDLSALDGYSYVPFQGYLTPAATVRAYLAQYATTPNVAPKVIMPTPRRRKGKRIL